MHLTGSSDNPKLYDINNTPIATTTTDATGYYSFTNLIAGTYSVGFILPTGYERSPKGAGTVPASDSNADPVTRPSTR